MNQIAGVFEPSQRIMIDEAAEGTKDVDGKHVLAKVRGEFFFPGGVSRNNRSIPSHFGNG